MDIQFGKPENSAPLVFPNLPLELITEILLRLPVKSLSKFRCVSKPWLSLITSSQFIKSHLKLSTENKEYTHHKLILLDLSHVNLKCYSLQSFLDAPLVDSAVNISPSVELAHAPFCIVGSCNGLICLEVKYDLWNPCTRKSKKLPNPIFEIEEGYRNCYGIYGFGYDESNDDYKVVAILEESLDGRDDVYRSTRVRIYSLRTDSWRSIGNFKEGVELRKSGKYFHGKLHWEVHHLVVSVDLETEMYEEFELPNYGGDGFDSALGEFEGNLAVVCCDHKNVYLWVMLEYGVKESWTKIFTVSLGIDLWSNYYSPVLCRKKNDEIILLHGPLLMAYNPKDDSHNNPRFVRFHEYAEVNIYVESLVSPLLMMDQTTYSNDNGQAGSLR